MVENGESDDDGGSSGKKVWAVFAEFIAPQKVELNVWEGILGLDP